MDKSLYFVKVNLGIESNERLTSHKDSWQWSPVFVTRAIRCGWARSNSQMPLLEDPEITGTVGVRLGLHVEQEQ